MRSGAPEVKKRCSSCGKAHYDDNFKTCRNCGASLPSAP